MGVDYYSCNSCEDTFPDCGDYEHCSDCGRKWCDMRCGESEGLETDLCESCKNDDGEHCECEGNKCGYCRNEIVDDNDLLYYALERLSMTMGELTKEYFANQN